MGLTKAQLNKLLKLKKELSRLDHQCDSHWAKHLLMELSIWSREELIKCFRYHNKRKQIEQLDKLILKRNAKKQELKDYWKGIVRPDDH